MTDFFEIFRDNCLSLLFRAVSLMTRFTQFLIFVHGIHKLKEYCLSMLKIPN